MLGNNTIGTSLSPIASKMSPVSPTPTNRCSPAQGTDRTSVDKCVLMAVAVTVGQYRPRAVAKPLTVLGPIVPVGDKP
jgi:hypothetical protein